MLPESLNFRFHNFCSGVWRLIYRIASQCESKVKWFWTDNPAVLCVCMWLFAAANLIAMLMHLTCLWPLNTEVPLMIRFMLSIHLLPVLLLMRLVVYLLRKLPPNPFEWQAATMTCSRVASLNLNRRHSERLTHNLLIELIFTFQLVLLLMLNRSISTSKPKFCKSIANAIILSFFHIRLINFNFNQIMK